MGGSSLGSTIGAVMDDGWRFDPGSGWWSNENTGQQTYDFADMYMPTSRSEEAHSSSNNIINRSSYTPTVPQGMPYNPFIGLNGASTVQYQSPQWGKMQHNPGNMQQTMYQSNPYLQAFNPFVMTTGLF